MSGTLEKLGEYLALVRPEILPLRPTEDGDNITYRRHWVILVRNVTLPVLVCMGGIALWVYYLLAGGIPVLLRLGWGPNLGLLALSCLPWLWLLWRYEDWRNDYYILTPDKIVDVNRLPFGFGGDLREAPMANVQNVNMRMPNFLATMLDFGDIEVDTAGQQGGLVFYSIHHPREVMAQVAARVDAFREGRLAREHESRQQELATWFSLYADLNRISITDSPPVARVGEEVEVVWRVSGQATDVETWLQWRLGEALYRTAQQSGGPGNYRGVFVVPLAREIHFSAGALIGTETYQSPEETLIASDFELVFPPEAPKGRPIPIRWRHASPADHAAILWDSRPHDRADAYPQIVEASLEGGWSVARITLQGDEAIYFRLRSQIGKTTLSSSEYRVSPSVPDGHAERARFPENPIR